MPSRPLWLFAAFVLIALVFAAVYWQAFGVKPASDDWPIVNEIHRGNRLGVGSFFTDSVIRIGYRPLKSLVIWTCGRLGGDSVDRQMAWIRAVHLLAALGYAIVAVLWLRYLPVRTVGWVAGFAIMLLHPVLPQAAGSVDGVDTLASSALLWLGAWCLLCFNGRPVPAIATSLTCFFVGIGFKENLFALVPLSVLVIVTFWRDHKWRNAALVGGTLALAAAAMIVVRFFVIRGGLSGGGQMITRSPVQIVENAALFGTGLLFLGNSIWVFVNQAKLVAALCCIAALVVIVGGLVLRRMDSAARIWLGFGLAGMAIASFPTILLYHVSEMYVPPLLLPFALICGISADGWRGVAWPARFAAAALALVALVFSLLAIHAKVAGLVDVGDRAYRQLQQIVSLLPPDARNLRIGARYLASDRSQGDRYAVFRMPDSILLVHRDVLDFALPYRGLTFDSAEVEDFSKVDPAGYDLIAGWDAARRTFIPLQPVPR